MPISGTLDAANGQLQPGTPASKLPVDLLTSPAVPTEIAVLHASTRALSSPMEHQSPRNPPPAPAAPTAPLTTDRAHWTPARQRIFLMALADTGCVAAAARAAGMSRFSAHRLRKRLAGTPFDRHWAEALRLHAARLADPFGDTTASARPVQQRGAAVAGPGRR